MDKQQKQEKPKWTKPEVTALVRHNTEEAVLGACKHFAGASSPNQAAFACADGAGNCFPCNSIAES